MGKRTPIVLIGMPGSGKTFLGQHAEKSLGCKWVDLDNQIEIETGFSAQEIISKQGETKFRDIERTCLERLLKGGKNELISTGGGTPCFFDTMEFLIENSIPIYLEVDIQTLINRLDQEVKKRPLLDHSLDLGTQLDEIFADRERYYSKAPVIISSLDLNEQLEILKAYCGSQKYT